MRITENQELAQHPRRRSSVRSMNLDLFIPLLFLLPIAVFYNGVRALFVIAVCVLACLCTEWVWYRLRRMKPPLRDLSSLVTGMTLAMLLPVGVPVWIPIVGGIFAIAVAKLPFGGTGNNPFNATAAAFAFLTICWPNRIFGYFPPQSKIPLDLLGDIQHTTVHSPAYSLAKGGAPSVSYFDMFLGNFAGPIGATAGLVIVVCCVYLIYRRAAIWQIPASFIAASGLIALLFPRISTGRLSSLIYELLSGSLLFVAVFIATDMTAAPKNGLARIFYGFSCGLLTMLFRYAGAFEQGACFAVLIINATSHALDSAGEKAGAYLTKTLKAKGGGKHAAD